jgi:hypothetical protein
VIVKRGVNRPLARSCVAKRFADDQIALATCVVTDGHTGLRGKSLGERSPDAKVQTKAERHENDAKLECCHRTISP